MSLMQLPYISKRKVISRRDCLRATGIALGLPALEAMSPVFAADRKDSPPRMIAICNNLGLLTDRFFPNGTGTGYLMSPYLSEMEGFRDRFTVLSGVSHPGVDGSHASDVSFLTAAPHPGGGGFRNSVSLDQVVAGKQGHLTRFPSMTLGVNAKEGRRSLSWTDSGVLIPCENGARNVYRNLFLQGSPDEVALQMRKLELGESIMDALADQRKTLQRGLGANDLERLDQYLTSVREVEKRMVMEREWKRLPKPVAPVPMPDAPTERSTAME